MMLKIPSACLPAVENSSSKKISIDKAERKIKISMEIPSTHIFCEINIANKIFCGASGKPIGRRTAYSRAKT